MSIRRSTAVVVASTCLALISTVAKAGPAVAPVTQVTPSASGPITFASTALGSNTSVTVSMQLNVSGTVTIAAPASANGYVEFSVGSVSGCTADGVTSNTAGSTCTFSVKFAPHYPGQRTEALAVTLNGQVYPFGMTGLGTGPQAHLDTTNIVTVTGAAGTTSTTAYTYKTGVPLGSTGILYEPEGVYADSNNNVYIADSGHALVRVAYQTQNPQLACFIIMENPTDFGLTAGSNTCAGATSQPTTGDLYTLAGTTSTAYSGDNVLATTADTTPSGIQVDSYGNLFIGDSGLARIRVVYQGGANIACLIMIENPTTFGLSAGATSCTGATSLPTPGYIYTIAGTGTSGYTGDGGLATAANLYSPNDTAVDAAGDVFMMNFTASATTTIGGRIRVIYNGGALAAQLITLENPTVTTPVVGDIYTVFGGANSEGGDGGLATATGAGALTIYGLRIDAYDNVYFSDKTYGSTSYGSATNQSRVRVVYNGTATNSNPLANFIALENPSLGGAANVKPGYVYTVAGETGTATVSAAVGDGVLATTQQFAGVYGFTLDPAGDIIVSDRLNYTIRRISAATGLINTIAGFPTSASTGTFNATGSSQLVPSGTVTTGIGQFFGPWGITSDSAGGFYITDYGGNRLRYLSSTSSSTYPLLLSSVATGAQTPIQYFWETNIGTPGSTLSVLADSVATPFGFLSPANVPGIAECAPTSTSTLAASTITTAVTLASGASCSFGLAAIPTNGGVNAGAATVSDTSLSTTSTAHTMYASVTATGVSTVLTWSPTPAVANSPEVLTATLTAPGAVPVTSGTVTFYITGSTTPLGSAALTSSGTASITTSALVSPSTSITTVYPGATTVNPLFTASTATTVIPVSLTVITLTSSNYAPNLGQSIMLTATVTSPVSGGAFSGTVTFYDGSTTQGTVLGTQTVSGAGIATLTTSSLAAGTHLLNAKYTNDPNYVNATTASSISVVVTAPAFTPTITSPAGIAIIDGQTGAINFQVQSVGGYTGTLLITCGPPAPTNFGCVVSPSSMVFTGSNTTQTGTVTFTAVNVNAQNHSTRTMFEALALPWLASLLFVFRRKQTLRKRLVHCACALLGVLLLTASGCGKNSNNNGQSAKGTFGVPLTFTDGTTTVTLNETVSIIGTSDAN